MLCNMLLFYLFPIGLLSLGIAKSEETNPQQFDALLTNAASLIETNESFKLQDNLVNMTACFWCKPLSKSSLSIGTNRNIYDAGWYISLNMPTRIQFVVIRSYYFIGVEVPPIELNIWQHFCLLHDGTNRKLTLIYNGNQTYEASNAFRDPIFKLSGTTLKINGNLDEGTNGSASISKISRLQIWDRFLEREEVNRQMQANAPEGNILSWLTTPWLFKNGAQKVLSELFPETVTTTEVTTATEEEESSATRSRHESYRYIGQEEHKGKEYFARTAANDLSDMKLKVDSIERVLKYFAENITKEVASYKKVISEENKDLDTRKDQCPDKFVLLAGRCYYFSTFILRNWNEALLACQTMNSTLVSIESRQEWYNLLHYLDKHKLLNSRWTGGTDLGLLSEEWLWSGTNHSVEFHTSCAKDYNEIRGGTRRCLLLAQFDKIWCFAARSCNDVPFYTKFICESDLDLHIATPHR